MNDRYLFRAKRTDNGEWVEGYYAVIGEKVVIIEKRGEEFYDIEGEKKSHGNKITEVDPSTICQCTGLKDKNGMLIWEKDIVQYRDCTIENYVIAWETNKACFEYQQYGCSIMDFEELSGIEVEVIGNIFDNAELLEVGE